MQLTQPTQRVPADHRLRPRVLLVEDEEESRVALREILEAEDFEVEAVGDGEAGIEFARSFAPHVVLLDLGLPGVNGFDAAEQLKKDARTAGIPLVAVTASWLGSERGRLGKIGFEGALRKPFAAAALLEELRRVLAN